ncbi:stage V sporulation protein AD [Eubacteriales bacterium OttesenSCG-928-K08]|nr:stage V sporulation protein AD [Eubacteriales bacterium OttesenSCG-928-K08]
MPRKRMGERTFAFKRPPYVWSSGSIVGDVEAAGPLGEKFDLVLEDDTWGEGSWEKAECKMFEHAVRIALEKCGLETEQLQCMLGGDLLNQIVTANYAARQLDVPFLGLYGACSTMAQALLLGSVLIDGGFLGNAACVSSSHFSTAERQYRFPLEMGTVSPPTAQRTVTGAGCTVLGAQPPESGGRNITTYNGVRVKEATLGKVVDMGILDAANMGAAMAPAAASTIMAFLRDTNRTPDMLDAIITGDLGVFGSEMLLELCDDEGIKLAGKHHDCGVMVFSPDQKLNCGGSGCGCPAVVLNAHILPRISAGEWRQVLFLATGALMSPTTSLQGESIPGIAHAVLIEKES